MNQIIKAWCEKNDLLMSIGKKGIFLDNFNGKFSVFTLIIDKKTYSISIWNVHPFYPILYVYDYIKDLQATLQCGLPMLWGI